MHLHASGITIGGSMAEEQKPGRGVNNNNSNINISHNREGEVQKQK